MLLVGKRIIWKRPDRFSYVLFQHVRIRFLWKEKLEKFLRKKNKFGKYCPTPFFIGFLYELKTMQSHDTNREDKEYYTKLIIEGAITLKKKDFYKFTKRSQTNLFKFGQDNVCRVS